MAAVADLVSTKGLGARAAVSTAAAASPPSSVVRDIFSPSVRVGEIVAGGGHAWSGEEPLAPCG